MNIQQLFALGMKRDVPQLLDFPVGVVVNLGCGRHHLEGAVNIDYPDWEAERYEIQLPREVIMPEHPMCIGDMLTGTGQLFRKQLVRCPDNFLAGVHAYHFLEHVHDPRRMLREIQRCLQPGGVANICVPHYWGSMAHHDLDHKHNFAVDTWANTFSAPWYDKDREGWTLRIHFNMLMAVTERNAAILTQLVNDNFQPDLGYISGTSGSAG
jgi:SAM-dependent methyltransferase